MMKREEQDISKNILFIQPVGIRNKGNARLSWRDEVDEEARMFGIGNWWLVIRDREEWKGLLEEAKTHR